MLSAVVFDMDGVIADSEPIHKAASIEALRHFGVKSIKKGISCKGRTVEETAKIYFKRYGISRKPEEYVKIKNNLVRREFALGLKPLRGAVELVKSLAAKERLKVALASSSTQEQIDFVINLFGIRDSFDTVVCGMEIGKGKPSPDIYLAAAERLGVRPATCLAIEDAVNGVVSAKKAGMRCLAVTNTYPRAELENAGADFVTDSLEDFDCERYLR